MDISAAIEAILFAAGESVPVARLSLVLGADEKEISLCAAELAEKYEGAYLFEKDGSSVRSMISMKI